MGGSRLTWLRRTRRVLRALWCVLSNGHEYYTVRSSTRIYQECVLCKWTTAGWDVAPTQTGKRHDG
jgi:hypothetical protein